MPKGTVPCAYVFPEGTRGFEAHGEHCPNKSRNLNKRPLTAKTSGLCATHQSRAWRGRDMNQPMVRGDKFFRADDGIVDDIAIDVVAYGQRKVPLTRREAELAVRKILRLGLTRQQTIERLGISANSAELLYAQQRKQLLAEGVTLDGVRA